MASCINYMCLRNGHHLVGMCPGLPLLSGASVKRNKGFITKPRNRSPRDWDMFKSCQHNCVAALRTAGWNYINNILSDTIETGNTKPFWRYVKSQKQERCGVSPLKQNGVLHSDSSVKARILNCQFSSVFTADDHNGDTVLEGPSIPPYFWPSY